MKTIKEIREAYAIRKGYDNWNDVLKTCSGSDILLTNIINEVSRQVAVEALREASINAEMMYKHPMSFDNDYIKEYKVYEHMQGGGVNYSVLINKKSITNSKNIPL